MKKQTNNAGQDKINLQALKESEARFRSIVLWSLDAIIVTDAKGKIEYMNPAAEEVFNRKLESFIGKDFGLPLVDGESTEIDIFRPGKDPGVGDMHVVETEWLNKKAHLIMIRDITERKRAEEALASSKQFLSDVIEQSPLSMWVSDSQGTMIRMNQTCRELFGATDGETVGKYNLFKDNLIEAQGFMPLVEAVFRKGEVARFTIDYDLPRVEHIKVSGAKHRIVDVVISPIKDLSGKVTNAIVQHKDITERKRAEEALARRMDELAQFNAAAVGRELRMVELKEQVNELARQLSQPPPYQMESLNEAVPASAPGTESGITGNPKSQTSNPGGDA